MSFRPDSRTWSANFSNLRASGIDRRHVPEPEDNDGWKLVYPSMQELTRERLLPVISASGQSLGHAFFSKMGARTKN